MTNSETISKLNEALSNLIKAYEELQNHNESLENKIDQLENEIEDLKQTKDNLESQLGEINEHTQKDNSNISTMLGRIETLLSNKKSNDSQEEIKQDSISQSIPENENNTIDDVNLLSPLNNQQIDEKPIVKEEDSSNSNKIDLNRMASLLNGFNR